LNGSAASCDAETGLAGGPLACIETSRPASISRLRLLRPRRRNPEPLLHREQRRVAPLPGSRYIRPIEQLATNQPTMRAETEKLVEDIKQSVGLLRRHL